MSRRALIVGIDGYIKAPTLSGCIADANEILSMLVKDEDGSPNYECRIILGDKQLTNQVTRPVLREAIHELFHDYQGEVLFYFSGHGAISNTGGYLATSDAEKGDLGIPMQEILTIANTSRAADVLLILDCCYSGDLGNLAITVPEHGESSLSLLRENLTIIAASRGSETAAEVGGHGVFTSAITDALRGGAADPMGFVTAPAIYGYVERRFGAWDQRPVYKSHATGVSIIRKCAPLIERYKLRELVALFPSQDHQYPLDPEYEPEDENGNVHEPVYAEKVRLAQLLKGFRDAGLIRPSISGEQLYWTARRNHTVELTPRGKEYLWLVSNDKI